MDPIYRLARPALFALDAERVHELTMAALARAGRTTGLVYGRRVPDAPREVMGLRFPNPVGLAAGLDKDARCLDGLAGLGFGFLEVGTVTPRPQPGNPKPRLFRLAAQQALINRLGFNNDGVERLVERVRRVRHDGVLGINIGKNFDTPVAQAHEDYLTCLERVYPHADYVTVNISSPNTVGLRDLQGPEALDGLLATLAEARERLAGRHGRRVPLALKVAPDLDEGSLETIADSALAHGLDALIATNTTVTRAGLDGVALARERGGLSGAPLAPLAESALRVLSAHLEGRLPIIAVGGIMRGEDAAARLAAGASLVQIYTGLIYRGPGFVRECVAAATRSSSAPSR